VNAEEPTVAIRVYYRGEPEGVVRHVPARFFRWHPASRGKKTHIVGSSLAGPLERKRDAYVDRIAPGNVGWEEVGSSRTNPDDKMIYRYTRKQAIADGVLVDMTEWASAKSGFLGGFAVPVAMTGPLWSDIDKEDRLQNTRGRAHDVLWMASLAVRRAQRLGVIGPNGGRVMFDVLLQVGRKRTLNLAVDLSGGDNGEPVVTIGYPADF